MLPRSRLLSRPLPSLRFTQLRVQPPSQRCRRPLAAGAPRSSPAPCSGEDPRPSPPRAAKRAHVGHRARRPSPLPSAAGRDSWGLRRPQDAQRQLQGLERVRLAENRRVPPRARCSRERTRTRRGVLFQAQEAGAHWSRSVARVVLLWFGVFCFVFVFLLGEIRPANCPETAEEGVGKGERET